MIQMELLGRHLKRQRERERETETEREREILMFGNMSQTGLKRDS